MKYYILILLELLLFCSCIKDDNPTDDKHFELTAGDKLPSFTLINSKDTLLSEIALKDKKSIIIFFSTTCGDCQRAFPEIQRLYNFFREDNEVCVVLIARSQTEAIVQEYLDQNSYDFTFYPDPERKVYALFADQTIPRVFVVNKQQIISLTQTEIVEAKTIIEAL